MTKTHKKIFGFLGLLTVVAVTAVAILMPTANTSAADTTSVTDTIVVKVTNGGPDVNILGINNGEYIVVPQQQFTAEYSNVELVTVSLEHTDLAGAVTNYDIDSFDAGYAAGSKDYTVNFIK